MKLSAHAKQRTWERLYALEHRLQTISAVQHRLAVERRKVEDEIRYLRVSLSEHDMARYRDLVFMRDG